MTRSRMSHPDTPAIVCTAFGRLELPLCTANDHIRIVSPPTNINTYPIYEPMHQN